jgi:uncharacterized protein (DUF305 family)
MLSTGPDVSTLRHATACVLLCAAASGCHGAAADRPALVQPGAPGESGRVTTAAAAADLSKVQHTDADVRFMQGMISHHAQALEMTSLLRTRTSRADMRLLAERIDVSQTDEIEFMRRWLQDRGAEAGDAHAHHGGGALMPGMLTPEQMARLAAVSGDEFDRMFLESMIAHHTGALSMVQELFATAGAGQESEIFAFASDVDADQRIEIRRMSAMLQEQQP